MGFARLFAALGEFWLTDPFFQPSWRPPQLSYSTRTILDPLEHATDVVCALQGNGMNCAVGALILITSVSLYIWAIQDNKRRDRLDAKQELAGLTEKEISSLDWKHPVTSGFS